MSAGKEKKNADNSSRSAGKNEEDSSRGSLGKMARMFAVTRFASDNAVTRVCYHHCTRRRRLLTREFVYEKFGIRKEIGYSIPRFDCIAEFAIHLDSITVNFGRAK